MKTDVLGILEREVFEAGSDSRDLCTRKDRPVTDFVSMVEVVSRDEEYIEAVARLPHELAHERHVLSEEIPCAHGSVHEVDVKLEISESKSVSESDVVHELSREILHHVH